MIRAKVDKFYAAYNAGDIEAIAEQSLGFEAGFGFRTQLPRRTEDKALSGNEIAELMKPFFDQMEYYDLWIDDISIEVHRNVSIAWGFHLESFKIKGREPVKVRVRFTQSFMLGEDGEMETLLCHRDIRQFGEDGRYRL